MDEHQHTLHYTLEMKQRHWWGGRVRYSVTGIGSSKQDNELLIRLPDGGFWSVNYMHVLRLVATPVPHEHA